MPRTHARVKGLVTDTITFSIVDGPGNRFVVFLQGCNFNCVACHNPYTINVCVDCGECVATCPSGALTLSNMGTMQWDDTICAGSETCIAVCPYDSTPKARPTEVDDLLVAVRRAAPFLSGVTVTGGEATQQAAFVEHLFRRIKTDSSLSRLTCFIDSNGATDTATWQLLAKTMDGAMIDLKCLDQDIHRAMTGQSNDLVLDSIDTLQSMGKLYEVRLLLLRGVNDDPALLARTGDWLARVDPTMRLKVIGFRRHGARIQNPPLEEPPNESLLAASEILRASGDFDICVI